MSVKKLHLYRKAQADADAAANYGTIEEAKEYIALLVELEEAYLERMVALSEYVDVFGKFYVAAWTTLGADGVENLTVEFVEARTLFEEASDAKDFYLEGIHFLKIEAESFPSV